jgi:hypothetical protein
MEVDGGGGGAGGVPEGRRRDLEYLLGAIKSSEVRDIHPPRFSWRLPVSRFRFVRSVPPIPLPP